MTIRIAPDDHARLRRLVEEDQRDRDREERRRADGDRGARRSGVADGEGEEELRAARPEHAGEQERPDPGEVDLAGATNGSVTSSAAAIVCSAPASASGSRASANRSATVIEPKSAADASASTTASTIQRYSDYDPPPWMIRAYASWPS